MHPVLFEIAGVTVYSYGFMIAIGSIAGIAYMAIQGKKEVALTFDQANGLFLCIFAAAFIGGKVFLFFEDPGYYLLYPARLVTGRGFVLDRKSTRLNSSHLVISYAVFCLKKNRITEFQ